ncbi:MAG: outer membrane protein assembly factor BamC [Glaciecola sp.]|jgi:outer membrane protein assembly factor BamC
MNSKVIGLSLFALAVSGCASKEERQIASGSYQYLEASQQKVLEVPAELDTPQFSRRYELPELGENADPSLVGERLKVVSPALILPLVAGSHVEEGSEDAKVLFDQMDDSEPLQKTVWDTVLKYLEKNQIGVESFEPDNRLLVTDWVVEMVETESAWYDFTDSFKPVRKKFKFTMNVAPHGRTASLKSNLIAYEDPEDNKTLSQVDVISKRNEESAFLNSVIAEYDFGLRLARTQRIAMIRQGFDSNMGFNEDGEPAIMVDAEYENTWPRLLLVLRKMGFDVKDLDQSTGLLFVQYTGAEQSWWGNLFGSSEGLQIEKEDYRLKVSDVGEKTAVTFMNDESAPFDTKLITEVFAPFKEYMGTENLDI